MELIKFYKSSSKLFLFDENAFTEIKDSFNVKDALYAFIILNAIISLFNGIIMYSGSSSRQPLYWLVIKTIIGLTSLNLVSIVASTAIIHAIIKLFGAKESYNTSLKFLISAFILPSIILAAINYIVQLIYIDTETLIFNTKDIIIVSIYAIITLSIILWNLVVVTKTFSKIHELSIKNILFSYAVTTVIGFIFLGIMMGLIYLILKSLTI